MTIDEITIRQARERDVPAMVALLGELFSLEQDFHSDPQRQRRGLERLMAADSATVQVAVADGRVVGMATVQAVVSTAEGGEAGVVEDVVVDPACRGRGVGRALLASLEQWADRRGLTRLQLLADRDNHPALGFYENLGWSRTKLICLRKR